MSIVESEDDAEREGTDLEFWQGGVGRWGQGKLFGKEVIPRLSLTLWLSTLCCWAWEGIAQRAKRMSARSGMRMILLLWSRSPDNLKHASRETTRGGV